MYSLNSTGYNRINYVATANVDLYNDNRRVMIGTQKGNVRAIKILYAYYQHACNGLAITALHLACDKVKESKIYKQKVKKLTELLVGRIEEHDILVRRIFGNSTDYIKDFEYKVSCELKKDVETLVYRIRYIFQSYKIPDADVYARTEVARTLTQLACIQSEIRAEDYMKQGVDVRGFAKKNGLNDIHRAINQLCTAAYPHIEANIGKDEVCMRLGENICEKLGRGEIIASAIKYADEENPDEEYIEI